MSIGMWYGKPIETLSREELIAVIERLGHDLQDARAEQTRMRRAVDWKKYLQLPRQQAAT